MPKRVLKHHLDKVAKIRRKSIAYDENQPINIEGDDDEHDDIDNKEKEIESKPEKHMRFMRLNKNNEIERLLMHNSKTLYYHVNHSEFPSFNVGRWTQEDNELLATYPSCAFSTPRPIYVANKQCEKVDLCYKRVMNREFQKKRITHTRTSYLNALKNKKVLRASEKDGIYHSAVFDLAERVLLQPDTYFHGSYDYYYTGGNLHVLPQSGNIIHAGGEQLRTLSISEFPVLENNTVSSSLTNVASQVSSEDSEIFEVHPLINSPNSSRQNLFITRQRNSIAFNYLTQNNEIKNLTQFRTKSTPFISFAQSERQPGNFIITTMKQHVRVYDLNMSSPKLVNLFEISPSKANILWNTVKPWRENTFLYANENQFFLIDTRTTPEQWMETSTMAVDNYMCDHISAMLPSEFNNLFYVATNHKLHCMDIRQLKKFSFNDPHGAICRWSHQLRYAPLMMDSFRLRQSECVALSSPLAGDLHICHLSRERSDTGEQMNKHIYSSPCLPYEPPSLIEAYENARLTGNCLRPEANLESRLKCCTTGLRFYNSSLNDTDSAIALLLTSNSNGDIFAHSLSKREKGEISEVRCNTTSDEVMAEFERKICDQVQPPLHYTEIKNMKSMRNIFLSKSLSSVPKYDLRAMPDEYSENETAGGNRNENPNATVQPPPRKRLHLGRWQKSISTLHSYKDALVPDLLSIWDIDIEEDKPARLGNLPSSLRIKDDPTSKVNDWLSANLTPNPPPMLTIPAQEISKYNSNTSMNTESMFNISQIQTTAIDFDCALHSTQIMDNTANVSAQFDTTGFEVLIQNETTTTAVEKLKTKKKTKKYVKGF